ncbi:MAG: hypothetical protein JSW10_03585 [Pseudomonadota bacterium]|nr:MAG: hypothetical protein JSW10_03585 [Pseudomonadota bacterium]
MDQAQGQYLGAREQIQTIRHESDHTVNLAMQLTQASQTRIADLERQLADLQAAEEMHISDFEYALKRERERSDAEEARLRDRIAAAERAAKVAAERANRRLAASQAETERTRQQALERERKLAEQQAQVDAQLSASAFYKEELDDLRQRFDRRQRQQELHTAETAQADTDGARHKAVTLAGRLEASDD